MIRKIVSALFAASLLFTSCLKSDEGLFAGKQELVGPHFIVVLTYSIVITVATVFCFLGQMKKQ